MSNPISNVFKLYFLALLPVYLSPQVFLQILSGASEYDELPLRHNEVIFLARHIYLKAVVAEQWFVGFQLT